ncbi:uncharacterized protein N7446_001199 [Penicillium canescens]|uniref:Uncharacterized protein n=1 Tax=Penicillium canescens TaxID=5083 RepID=A0AAD6N8B1_PENCN|nr:uncharacterized protein N7446_001199 [Penicillium canescens]KAJ6043003.1 hypothetical protein N7460_004358 [Penicillium canescens]KAJ6054476.1 hypothetical protein N7444_003574 [Penicillium canescens]KAJ6073422.1 hypothetical protein N7446_001199 [Penicillium canescens]
MHSLALGIPSTTPLPSFYSLFYYTTPNNYNEIATYQTKYSDLFVSVVPMLPSLHTAGKIAYDEDFTSPFSICYQASNYANSSNKHTLRMLCRMVFRYIFLAKFLNLPMCTLHRLISQLIIYSVYPFPGAITYILLHGRSLATTSNITRDIYFHIPTHARIHFIYDIFPLSGLIADNVAKLKAERIKRVKL